MATDQCYLIIQDNADHGTFIKSTTFNRFKNPNITIVNTILTPYHTSSRLTNTDPTNTSHNEKESISIDNRSNIIHCLKSLLFPTKWNSLDCSQYSFHPQYFHPIPQSKFKRFLFQTPVSHTPPSTQLYYQNYEFLRE